MCADFAADAADALVAANEPLSAGDKNLGEVQNLNSTKATMEKEIPKDVVFVTHMGLTGWNKKENQLHISREDLDKLNVEDTMLKSNCPVLSEAKAFYKSKVFGGMCISLFEVTSPEYKYFRLVFDIDDCKTLDDIKKCYDFLDKLECVLGKCSVGDYTNDKEVNEAYPRIKYNPKAEKFYSMHAVFYERVITLDQFKKLFDKDINEEITMNGLPIDYSIYSNIIKGNARLLRISAFNKVQFGKGKTVENAADIHDLDGNPLPTSTNLMLPDGSEELLTNEELIASGLLNLKDTDESAEEEKSLNKKTKTDKKCKKVDDEELPKMDSEEDTTNGDKISTEVTGNDATLELFDAVSNCLCSDTITLHKTSEEKVSVEIAAPQLLSSMLSCEKEDITEDYIMEKFLEICDEVTMSKGLKPISNKRKDWDNYVKGIKKDYKEGKLNPEKSFGYAIAAAKSHNPEEYNKQVLPLLRKQNTEGAVEIHNIDFSEDFDFQNIREKLANKEYKTVNDIVSDLTKVIKFIDNEGGMFVRKDYNTLAMMSTLSYLTPTQMKTYANMSAPFKLQKAVNGKKTLKLWDIISQNTNHLRLKGIRFTTEDPNFFSYFHDYKYGKLSLKSDENLIVNLDTIQKFLDFIKECIANNDERVYSYLINWIAYMVQNPGVKTEVAVILKGLQGSGKSTFTNVVSEMLAGYSARNITELNEITGDFNSVIENMMLLVLNEVKNAGDERIANFDSLKSKITDDTVRINEKNQPRRTAENVANFIFCTNNAYPVKLESSDRRYLVLMTSDAHVNDFKYWKELMSTMYTDTAGKKPNCLFFTELTKYFLKHDISEFNPRDIPETEAKQDLVNASRSPLEVWIMENYEELVAGTMTCSDAADNKPRNMKLQHFRNGINTYCDKVKPMSNGKRSTCYHYKLKEACKNMFKPNSE